MTITYEINNRYILSYGGGHYHNIDTLLTLFRVYNRVTSSLESRTRFEATKQYVILQINGVERWSRGIFIVLQVRSIHLYSVVRSLYIILLHANDDGREWIRWQIDVRMNKYVSQSSRLPLHRSVVRLQSAFPFTFLHCTNTEFH